MLRNTIEQWLLENFGEMFDTNKKHRVINKLIEKMVPGICGLIDDIQKHPDADAKWKFNTLDNFINGE